MGVDLCIHAADWLQSGALARMAFSEGLETGSEIETVSDLVAGLMPVLGLTLVSEASKGVEEVRLSEASEVDFEEVTDAQEGKVGINPADTSGDPLDDAKKENESSFAWLLQGLLNVWAVICEKVTKLCATLREIAGFEPQPESGYHKTA